MPLLQAFTKNQLHDFCIFGAMACAAPQNLYFEARGGLGGFKLDEIEAATSFPMLPMARDGLKWPVMSPKV